MTPSGRLGRAKLIALEEKLSRRDRLILRTLQQHRFLTTHQITDFCFRDKPTRTAALRSANRALRKLRELSVIDAMQRRIGGVRAGSGGTVWSITEAGHRLLHVGTPSEDTARRRFREPSRTFLEHTLAVATVHLALQHAVTAASSSAQHLELTRVELEPGCWRCYLGPAGVALTLKPDLAAMTETAEFEDHWFFEVDRATEPPSRIVRKCQQYAQYYRTGIEQHRHGVFPLVVWIVPTVERQRQLHDRLHEDDNVDDRLFRVITIDQLPALLLPDTPETPSPHPQERRPQ